LEFTKFEVVSISNHPELNEHWVQDRIAEDPSILGLGDLVLKDRERSQPRAGRLDLLLQDAESTRRFEVEVQLGSTDESHIIRTIEYWDLERRLYPQYEHTAVIVAEDITSRFLNVVSLFNGHIPLVAIQMHAMRVDDKIGLVFNTVVSRMQLGLVDEDEEGSDLTDRAYWETRGSKKTVAMADEMLALAKVHDPALELKYNKFYIGLARAGQPFNFMILRPKKGFLRLEPRLANTPEMQKLLESSELDVLEDYDSRWGRYRIRLQPGDITRHRTALAELVAKAFAEGTRE